MTREYKFSTIVSKVSSFVDNPVHTVKVFWKYLLNEDRYYFGRRGMECRGTMSPAKMIEPSDLQNDLQAPQYRLRASGYVSEPPTFCLHALHFGLQKNSWLLHSPKNLFLEKLHHDKIVFNDTLTICIEKSTLIELKGFIFVFLNFTNSLTL